MRTLIITTFVGLWLGLAVVACSKSGDSDKASGGSGGSHGAVDGVIAAWKDAKLTPSALAPATVTFGKDCQSGTVEGVDVLLCSFASAAEAKAAEDQGLAWIGQATGASQAHGAALVVLADRRKTDPSGRAINRLMKLAPN